MTAVSVGRRSLRCFFGRAGAKGPQRVCVCTQSHVCVNGLSGDLRGGVVAAVHAHLVDGAGRRRPLSVTAGPPFPL